jgi:hypothetical protein
LGAGADCDPGSADIACAHAVVVDGVGDVVLDQVDLVCLVPVGFQEGCDGVGGFSFTTEANMSASSCMK